MTGPSNPLAQKHFRRGQRLLPLLISLLGGPLGCSHDQPTENVLDTPSTEVGRRHPHLTAPETASPAPALSFSVGRSALGPADGPKVLILADADGPSTAALANSLAQAGYQVTTRPAPENSWNGTNPSLTGYRAVIHLDGVTWSQPLPAAAQAALSDFVENGGGFIGHQWNGYEAAVGQQAAMPNLVLQGYSQTGKEQECGPCSVTYTGIRGRSNHPVLAGLPGSFTFPADGHHAGPIMPFLNHPSTMLMRIPTGNPAVLVRRFGRGRVVNFSFSPNYGLGGAGRTLLDPNIQRLYRNAVRWTMGLAGRRPA